MPISRYITSLHATGRNPHLQPFQVCVCVCIGEGKKNEKGAVSVKIKSMFHVTKQRSMFSHLQEVVRGWQEGEASFLFRDHLLHTEQAT